MKKRLPATEAALKDIFATGAEGRLQAGDNIGVWGSATRSCTPDNFRWRPGIRSGP